MNGVQQPTADNIASLAAYSDTVKARVIQALNNARDLLEGRGYSNLNIEALETELEKAFSTNNRDTLERLASSNIISILEDAYNIYRIALSEIATRDAIAQLEVILNV